MPFSLKAPWTSRRQEEASSDGESFVSVTENDLSLNAVKGSQEESSRPYLEPKEETPEEYPPTFKLEPEDHCIFVEQMENSESAVDQLESQGIELKHCLQLEVDDLRTRESKLLDNQRYLEDRVFSLESTLEALQQSQKHAVSPEDLSEFRIQMRQEKQQMKQLSRDMQKAKQQNQAELASRVAGLEGIVLQRHLEVENELDSTEAWPWSQRQNEILRLEHRLEKMVWNLVWNVWDQQGVLDIRVSELEADVSREEMANIKSAISELKTDSLRNAPFSMTDLEAFVTDLVTDLFASGAHIRLNPLQKPPSMPQWHNLGPIKRVSKPIPGYQSEPEMKPIIDIIEKAMDKEEDRSRSNSRSKYTKLIPMRSGQRFVDYLPLFLEIVLQMKTPTCDWVFWLSRNISFGLRSFVRRPTWEDRTANPALDTFVAFAFDCSLAEETLCAAFGDWNLSERSFPAYY